MGCEPLGRRPTSVPGSKYCQHRTYDSTTSIITGYRQRAQNVAGCEPRNLRIKQAGEQFAHDRRWRREAERQPRKPLTSSPLPQDRLKHDAKALRPPRRYPAMRFLVRSLRELDWRSRHKPDRRQRLQQLPGKQLYRAQRLESRLCYGVRPIRREIVI